LAPTALSRTHERSWNPTLGRGGQSTWCECSTGLNSNTSTNAGKENGYLKVLYDDFVKHRVSRRFIMPALQEGVVRGLLRIEHQGSYAGGDPSMYRLTYLPSKFVPVAGAPSYLDPTNEWRSSPASRNRKEGHSSGAPHQK
jgi:hypothetical protein